MYSLAIALMEYMNATGEHFPIQVFGTDISEPALAKARAGRYPEGVAADLAPERLRNFFSRVDGHYQINKSIRDMCLFARQNVVKDPPFSHLDLISCRNRADLPGADPAGQGSATVSLRAERPMDI